MKELLEKNKIVLGMVAGGLAVGMLAWFWQSAPADRPLPTPTPLAAGECSNIPALADNVLKLVTKVIDGDTFLIEGGYSLRILGIDADERGYPCYEPAKNRLEELILNKEVKLEKSVEDKDQYCRYLRYAFLPAFAEVFDSEAQTRGASAGKGDKNISLELIKEGLAIARFYPENIKYRQEITQAEKEAKDDKIGCKWSASSLDKLGTTADKSSDAKVEFSWEKLTPEATNLKVIGACQAGNFYGQEVIVEGKIADAFRSKTNTVFLNFAKPYPNQCFTGVIFSLSQYRFVQNPENYYSNKTIRIVGELKEYKGKPEIILEDSSQIEIGK